MRVRPERERRVWPGWEVLVGSVGVRSGSMAGRSGERYRGPAGAIWGMAGSEMDR